MLSSQENRYLSKLYADETPNPRKYAKFVVRCLRRRVNKKYVENGIDRDKASKHTTYKYYFEAFVDTRFALGLDRIGSGAYKTAYANKKFGVVFKMLHNANCTEGLAEPITLARRYPSLFPKIYHVSSSMIFSLEEYLPESAFYGIEKSGDYKSSVDFYDVLFGEKAKKTKFYKSSEHNKNIVSICNTSGMFDIKPANMGSRKDGTLLFIDIRDDSYRGKFR